MNPMYSHYDFVMNLVTLYLFNMIRWLTCWLEQLCGLNRTLNRSNQICIYFIAISSAINQSNRSPDQFHSDFVMKKIYENILRDPAKKQTLAAELILVQICWYQWSLSFVIRNILLITSPRTQYERHLVNKLYVSLMRGYFIDNELYHSQGAHCELLRVSTRNFVIREPPIQISILTLMNSPQLSRQVIGWTYLGQPHQIPYDLISNPQEYRYNPHHHAKKEKLTTGSYLSKFAPINGMYCELCHSQETRSNFTTNKILATLSQQIV
eukprot:TRINITY_DN915_c1_g1_i1.p1 TRINITY_DN915_c1_g1~~TRINITY_DN915_c1_g1_i1.p1  ORF type:complete len:267 (-),score=-19.55 TRINITY_DN915_c1_g1_i1:187-987(-)